MAEPTTPEQIKQMLAWLDEFEKYQPETRGAMDSWVRPGIRPMLEAARDQIDTASEYDSIQREIARTEAVEAMIAPLWKAFTEARDAN